MKCFKNSSFVIGLLVMISFSACQKTNSSTANTPSADSLTTALSTGKWFISSLVQKKEDNTSRFAGYVFTFSANGKLTASLNGVETQGSWSHTPAVTYYGSSSKEAMVLNMGTDNLFKRISKTWNVVSKASGTIQLENPEILEDEHLQIQHQ